MFTERNVISCTCLTPYTRNIDVERVTRKHTTLIYITNPLSEACWKHQSMVRDIQSYCTQKEITFSLLMGYLRQEICADGTFFPSLIKNDTEPACRAVAAARILLLQNDHNDEKLLHFVTSIQKKFFENKEDATRTKFYQSICEEHQLPYDAFVDIFNIITTTVEFNTTKKLGISCYPNFIVDQLGALYPLQDEPLSFESITASLERLR